MGGGSLERRLGTDKHGRETGEWERNHGNSIPNPNLPNSVQKNLSDPNTAPGHYKHGKVNNPNFSFQIRIVAIEVNWPHTENKELQELAKFVPDIITKAIAADTFKSHAQGYQTWVQWKKSFQKSNGKYGKRCKTMFLPGTHNTVMSVICMCVISIKQTPLIVERNSPKRSIRNTIALIIPTSWRVLYIGIPLPNVLFILFLNLVIFTDAIPKLGEPLQEDIYPSIYPSIYLCSHFKYFATSYMTTTNWI